MTVTAYHGTRSGETTVREILRDGSVIAVLNAVDYGDSFTVVTEVFAQGREDGEVLRRRSYTFPDADAGMAFITETLTSFTYLGCEIR